MFTPDASITYTVIFGRGSEPDMYTVTIYDAASRICVHQREYNILWMTRIVRYANIREVTDRIGGDLARTVLTNFAKSKEAVYNNMCW